MLPARTGRAAEDRPPQQARRGRADALVESADQALGSTHDQVDQAGQREPRRSRPIAR